MRVALQLRDRVAGAGEELGLPVARVRLGPPPRSVDGSPSVWSHDQVAARLVEALPELPPGGRAAVAEVEVDRRGDSQDLRGFHVLSMLLRRRRQPESSSP